LIGSDGTVKSVLTLKRDVTLTLEDTAVSGQVGVILSRFSLDPLARGFGLDSTGCKCLSPFLSCELVQSK
jgi:hypothetical protein